MVDLPNHDPQPEKWKVRLRQIDQWIVRDISGGRQPLIVALCLIPVFPAAAAFSMEAPDLVSYSLLIVGGLLGLAMLGYIYHVYFDRLDSDAIWSVRKDRETLKRGGYPPRRCRICGTVRPDLGISESEADHYGWDCEACGAVLDRDGDPLF